MKKKEILKAKLSQLPFSEIKALKELTENDFDELIKDSSIEDVESLELEKKEKIEIINESISDKLLKFFEI